MIGFFEALCGALCDLPAERLATEIQILQTEESRRTIDGPTRLLGMRYGARGLGLASLPQFGLHRATAEAAREWAARWFTRDNAVAWVAGPPPPGLRFPLPPAVMRAETEAVTAEYVAEEFRQALPRRLHVIPAGCQVPNAGMYRVPQYSRTEVSGRELKPAKATTPTEKGTRLVVGPDGVTLRLLVGHAFTVRYADCVAFLSWSDGARLLLGTDGFRIRVNPSEWKSSDRVTGEIDVALQHVAVPMGTSPKF